VASGETESVEQTVTLGGRGLELTVVEGAPWVTVSSETPGFFAGECTKVIVRVDTREVREVPIAIVAARACFHVRLVGAVRVREVVPINVGDLACLAGGQCRFSFKVKVPVRPVEVIVEKGPVVQPKFRALGGDE
jgi:hypothetical protein